MSFAEASAAGRLDRLKRQVSFLEELPMFRTLSRTAGWNVLFLLFPRVQRSLTDVTSKAGLPRTQEGSEMRFPLYERQSPRSGSFYSTYFRKKSNFFQ